MPMTIKRYNGRCHCGAVTFEAVLDQDKDKFVACNCSLCTRKTRGVGLVGAEDFSLLSGEQALGIYQWNTRREKHFFCKTCGIHTHHTLADPPARVGVSLACLDGFDDNAVELIVGDGASIPVVSESGSTTP